MNNCPHPLLLPYWDKLGSFSSDSHSMTLPDHSYEIKIDENPPAITFEESSHCAYTSSVSVEKSVKGTWSVLRAAGEEVVLSINANDGLKRVLCIDREDVSLLSVEEWEKWDLQRQSARLAMGNVPHHAMLPYWKKEGTCSVFHDKPEPETISHKIKVDENPPTIRVEMTSHCKTTNLTRLVESLSGTWSILEAVNQMVALKIEGVNQNNEPVTRVLQIISLVTLMNMEEWEEKRRWHRTHIEEHNAKIKEIMARYGSGRRE